MVPAKTNDYIIIIKPRLGFESIFPSGSVFRVTYDMRAIKVNPKDNTTEGYTYGLWDIYVGSEFVVQPSFFPDLLIKETPLPTELKLDNLYTNIQQWSIDRELHVADPRVQMVKLVEEVGELAAGILKNKTDKIVDGIGDVFVVLTILAQQLGTDVPTCVSAAWGEIKDRKGKTINGTFVKETDISTSNEIPSEPMINHESQ